MLVRIAAALIDAWLTARRLLAACSTALATLWWTQPADGLARLVLRACRVPGPTRRLSVASVGEVLLVEDPRLARYLDVMPVRPFAQTIGRHVLCRVALPEVTLRHELEHARQWRRLGPLFLPAYIAAAGLACLRGGHPYRDNRFEVTARACE